jgi:putative membrane protein
MIGPDDLPAVNALLNAASAVLITIGFLAIRRKRIELHQRCMLTAVGVSSAFLASYLYYHFAVRHGQPTRFTEEGAARLLYFIVLGSHTLLAILAAPLVLITTWLGWTHRLVNHVRLARWTVPIWLYVSLTGVLVYWMLYHLYPPVDSTVTIAIEP